MAHTCHRMFKHMPNFCWHFFLCISVVLGKVLVALVEKWKSCNDKEKSFGALMRNVSKAFDSLSHKLIIWKLHAYGFDQHALELIHSYLPERKQQTKLVVPCSSWMKNLFAAPQGFILGPLHYCSYAIYLCI